MKRENGTKKSWIVFSLVASLSFTAVACASTPKPATQGGAAAVQTATPVPTPTAETDAELYEKAKKEGKVTVYTASTGVTNEAKASFEKQYPEIKVEVYSLGTQALMDKVIQEQKAGIYNADFVLIKENGGAIKHEMVDRGAFETYIPADIADKLVEPYNKAMGFVSFLQFKSVLYNTDAFQTPPVTNWWDLTTPEWKGRVLMIDPAKGGPQLDFITAFVVHADEMKQAYKDKFGKDIVLNNTENAGYEFIQQLEKNVVLFKSEDELIDGVAKSSPAKPMVAIANTDDLQTVKEKNLHADMTYKMNPRVSVVNPAYLFLAKNAAHPNAAKLLVRWMAGGADGQAKGMEPFVQQGAWLVRKDVKVNNPVELDQVKLWPYDSDAFYQASPKVSEFWLKQQ